MDPERRKQRIDGLKAIVTERDPGDWVDDQLADIRSKAEANEAAAN
jgi:trehalose 6-phosphate synthase